MPNRLGHSGWRSEALCSKVPGATVLMYGYSLAKVRSAQKICMECPVRIECLNHALKFREDHGVWGGVGAKDRSELRKGRTKKVEMYCHGKWKRVDPFGDIKGA